MASIAWLLLLASLAASVNWNRCCAGPTSRLHGVLQPFVTVCIVFFIVFVRFSTMMIRGLHVDVMRVSYRTCDQDIVNKSSNGPAALDRLSAVAAAQRHLRLGTGAIMRCKWRAFRARLELNLKGRPAMTRLEEPCYVQCRLRFGA